MSSRVNEVNGENLQDPPIKNPGYANGRMLLIRHQLVDLLRRPRNKYSSIGSEMIPPVPWGMCTGVWRRAVGRGHGSATTLYGP